MYFATLLVSLGSVIFIRGGIIKINEKISEPVIFYDKGTSVTLGWTYDHRKLDGRELFCGYEKENGWFEPLAVDATGKNFDLVTMKESTDFKRLASRCTSTYARMIDDGFTAERGLTLTNLTINDAGEYLCALYDKKTHWFEFGGTITLVAKEDMRNSIPPNEGKSRPLANLPPTEISSNTIPLEKSTSIVSNPVQMKDEFSNYNIIKSQKLILEKLENNIPDTTPRTSHLSQRKPNEKKPHVLIITLAVGIPCVIFFLGSAFIIYYHKKMEAAISYTLLTDHNENSCHDSSDEEDVKYER